LIASSVTLAGCQQMGFRSRTDELKQMMAEQDDWALPQSSQSRVPRPNVSGVMDRKRSDTTDRLASDDGEESVRRPSQQSRNREYRNSTDEDENDSMSTSIISTDVQEIDIQGAMAVVPAKYRDALRKQLEIVPKPTLAIDNENRSLTHDDQTIQDTQSPMERVTKEGKQIAFQEAPMEKASGKVTVRISDAKVDKQDANLDTSVVSAIALSQPASVGPDQMSTQVIRASAVGPIHAIATSVSNTETMPPQSSIAPTAPSWRQLLNQSIEQLEKQIKEIPPTDESLRISQEVTLRMLYLSQRRLNDATREIDVLSDQEQDYFRHQMQALYEASNPDAMPVRSRHWSLVMNSQREATNLLAAISNLEVKSAAFCTKVEGYGVVSKFPKYHFNADQELLLYCEIENVAATKVKEGFESQLQGSYEIIDSQGRKVADQLLPVEAEICQNHRRDYFIVYKIFMPQQIAPGNYQLRLTVEDTKARKFGQSHLDFQIKK